MSFILGIPAALGTTWGAIGTGAAITAGVAGTGISAYGTIQSGQAQAAMARRNANYISPISRYNAEVARRGVEAARRNAETIKQAGEAEAARHRQKSSDLLAQQRVAYAASGVEFEGSPLLVMQETAARAEQDALSILYNYQVKAAEQKRQAWKMETGANLTEWEGVRQTALQRYSGDQAVTAGWLGGATSLLKGGYEMYRDISRYKSPFLSKVE